MGVRWEPDALTIARHVRACATHNIDPHHRLDLILLRRPLLLGALDLLTRLRWPQCAFQKKLLIAAAIAECHPASAEILLPKRRSWFGIFVEALRIALRVVGKCVTVIPLVLLPGFVWRNAGAQSAEDKEDKEYREYASCSSTASSSPSDIIVVGSGPAGIHAALRCIEDGASVTILDGGIQPPALLADPPDENFEDLRRSPDQWRWFLGENLDNIPIGGLAGGHGGGMAGGNRSYVTAATAERLPLRGSAFVLQSLAEGGLAAAWGGICSYLTPTEHRAMGLPDAEMAQHYRAIAERIGIADREGRPGTLPPLALDHHGSRILERTRRRADILQRRGIRVEQPPAAILTRDFGDRRALRYRDMEYYADPGRSVYRPQWTLEHLKRHPRVRYVPEQIVEIATEDGDGVTVRARTFTGTCTQWRARRLLLAAGAVNTARILLRSRGLTDIPVPVLVKPHCYVPCLHLAMLGEPGPKARAAICQLAVTDTECHAGLDAGCAQLYSYRSLLLFRMLSGAPAPLPEALAALSLLAPALVIADIRFPVFPTAGSTMRLSGDSLHVDVVRTAEELTRHHRSLRRLRAALRTIGLLPLQTIGAPEGSASHYAGTVPIADQPGVLPLSCNRRGLLHGSQSIFIADAAAFAALPAKPTTFAIMANARRTAAEALHTS